GRAAGGPPGGGQRGGRGPEHGRSRGGGAGGDGDRDDHGAHAELLQYGVGDVRDRGLGGSEQPGAREDAHGDGAGHVRDVQREGGQADQVRGGAVHRRRLRQQQRG